MDNEAFGCGNKTLHNIVGSIGGLHVSNVDDLVAWLLAGQDDWGSNRVQEVIQAGQSRDVDLKRNVPLYMIYVTAWATEDGMVHFRRDLYGRDGVGPAARRGGAGGSSG